MAIINGTSGADTLSGTTGDDTINASGGNDVINLSRGTDVVDGGDGTDTLQVADGALTEFGFGAGAHRYILTADRISDASGALNTRFSNVETVYIVDRSGANVTYEAGGGASATLAMEVGRGDHRIIGSAGGGFESLIATIETKGAEVILSAGNERVIQISQAGGTNVTAQRIESIVIQARDVSLGLYVTSNILGTAQSIVIIATEATDIIKGGRELDQIHVRGTANDADRYTGGEGADIFVLQGMSRFGINGQITDYSFDDQISLRASTLDGIVPKFIGQSAFSGLIGEVRYEFAGNTTVISSDSDGNHIADQYLTITNGRFALTENRTNELRGTPVSDSPTVINGTNENDTISSPLNGDFIINGFAGYDIINGGAGNDHILGGSENDTLTGYYGNDTLDGGAGADEMEGGIGNDIYIVDSREDVVEEIIDGGTDTVFSSVNYSLNTYSYIEALSTAQNAQTTSIDLTGNNLAQTIIGNYGVNRLTGGGDADTLIGLRGNDTYMVDDARATIVEAAGEGADVAIVSAAAGAASYTLTAGAEVELLQAAAGAEAINITGNGFAQRVEGNAGANILNGGGGNDTLVGFGGDDTYLVRELGSVVIEGNGGGSDTVFTTVSYNLGINEVEVLSTVVNADTVAIDLIGNFATQRVIGNYGANVLNGGSGGADTLIGLLGNDVYAAGSQSITIVENAGEGSDTLVVFADYQIRGGVSIEVFAAQNRGGTETLTLRGNEVAQTVVGNAGANTIDGRGGADVLIGDADADVFAFTTALGTGNVDTILDFGNGADRIGLASDVFAALGGGIAAGAFVVGSAAADADDRLLYDQPSGRLFYDADANGALAAVQFAQLAAGTVLTAASFTVVAPVADLA